MKKISDIKCPKCKKNKVSELTEILDRGYALFLVEDGKKLIRGAMNCGSPSKVLAKCECGYEWSLKKIKSIDDIDAGYIEPFSFIDEKLTKCVD